MSDDSNPGTSRAGTPRRDSTPGAPTWRVATYNVENHLDDTASRGCVKSAASKAKVRECIRALRPDVLALQEIGSVAALMELRAALQAVGLDFPHWEHVTGSDANVHLAILSRFPFSAHRPHTDDTFELGGQRFRVRRGFAEVDVQVNSGCQLRCWSQNTNNWANSNPPAPSPKNTTASPPTSSHQREWGNHEKSNPSLTERNPHGRIGT